MVSKAQRAREREARRRRKAEEKQQKRQPTRFQHSYSTPEALAVVGPVVVAWWSVPRVLAEKLAALNKPVPPPVHGALMIDTGATATCISDQAARELELKPLRVATTYGAHGAQQAHVYLARLQIVIGHAQTRATTLIEYECEAQEVKDLERFSDAAGLSRGQQPVRYIGLLGRDMLRHARFEYDGIAGEIRVHFELGTLVQRQP